MRKIIFYLTSGIAAIILVAAAPVSVYAKNGDSGSGTGSGSTTESHGGTEPDTTITPNTESHGGTSNTSNTSNTSGRDSGTHTGSGGSGHAAGSEDNTTSKDDTGDKPETGKQLTAAAKEHRLDDIKIKVCERRQTNIKAIMDRSIDRASKQLTLFSTVAERTEAFYVKSGKTLSNYDELVSAANAAQAKAQSDLDALKASNTFTCDGSDPLGAAGTFKQALETERQDLRAYRTAVKNLIAGVKSAVGGDE